MSIKRLEKITCPNCRKETVFTVWDSINSEMDFLIPDIISGKLFEMTCDGCGHQTTIEYPILFNDMIHHATIYFTPNQEVPADDEIEVFRITGNHIRFVFSLLEFREKTAIYNAGLDDRIIEIAKVLLFAELESQLEGRQINKISLNIADAGYEWEIVIGEEIYYLEVPTALFDRLADIFDSFLTSPAEEPCIIDFNWAANFLSELYSNGNFP